MKKLLISLSAIAMLVAGATVASAAGGYVVDYNEALSVEGEKAVIDVYLDATSDEGFASFACQSAIYSGTINVTKNYATSVNCIPYGNLTTAQVKYTNGVLIVMGNGTAAEPLLAGDNGQLARFELTLSQKLTEDLIIKATRATAYAPITNGAAGAKVTTTDLDEFDTFKPLTPAGGSAPATQSGSTFTDAANAKAVAYVAELDSSASEKTGRWYATIGGTPMKTVATFTLPNISAEKVKLGLVYKGAETVSDVAFKWE